MKILVADDSFDWLNMHSLTLNEVFGEDAEIISACSASEALNIYKDEYKDEPFYLVITDMQMESDFEPMYAGEWLIKEIQALNELQNILIVSSTSNIELIAADNGVDYISKQTILDDPDYFKTRLETLYA